MDRTSFNEYPVPGMAVKQNVLLKQENVSVNLCKLVAVIVEEGINVLNMLAPVIILLCPRVLNLAAIG